MDELILPRLNKTGEYALVELSMRESRRKPNTVNVRMSLPRRSMFVAAGGDVEMLPRSPSDSTGLPLCQFAVSLH